MHAMKSALSLILALGVAQVALAETKRDDQMIKLATNSGCFICHHVETDSKGPNGGPPIGPNWQDVAARYRGQPDAKAALVEAVLRGSNDYASHWKGKVSGLAMPPNAVAIKRADANKLVDWILSLK